MANFDVYPRVVTTDPGTTAGGAAPAAGLVPAALQVMEVPFAAGSAGTADDVSFSVPAKCRLLTARVSVVTAIGSTTVTLRDTAAGGGTALTSAVSSAAAGEIASNTTTAPATITAGQTLFLRRSDRGVAGTLQLFLLPLQ